MMKIKYIGGLVMAFTLIGTIAIAGEFLLAGHSHTDQKVINHGGGLDSCGGHYNRKTGQYHYHRPTSC